MKLIIIALVCLMSGLMYGTVFSQGFTPPVFVLGGTLDGNFATNDAYGTAFKSVDTYNMVWGKGFSIHAKYGVDVRRKHRITYSLSYNNMQNDNSYTIPFIDIPMHSPYTDFRIYSQAIGYEYTFNARCKNKQFLGAALTANVISSHKESVYLMNNAFRIGFQIVTGYEFTLGKKQDMGLMIGLKYHIPNIGNQENGINTLNDGTGNPGAGFWRRVGILSLNLGFNFYTGVVPYLQK